MAIPAVSTPAPAKGLSPSLQAHTAAELAEVAAECWDRWLEAGLREVQYRREVRALKAQVARLQGRLRFQRAAAHSHLETLLPS